MHSTGSFTLAFGLYLISLLPHLRYFKIFFNILIATKEVGEEVAGSDQWILIITFTA